MRPQTPGCCYFCGDKATCGTNPSGRWEHQINLCDGCYEEWVERFPDVDPTNLKRLNCFACGGKGTRVISFDQIGASAWEPDTRTCQTCSGYGWRLAKKSPLERLAEASGP
jgi:hypothetical protein